LRAVGSANVITIDVVDEGCKVGLYERIHSLFSTDRKETRIWKQKEI